MQGNRSYSSCSRSSMDSCSKCHATRVAQRKRTLTIQEIMKPPSFSGSRPRLCCLLAISAAVLVSVFGSGSVNFSTPPKAALYRAPAHLAPDVRAYSDSQPSVELRPAQEDLQIGSLLNHRCTPKSDLFSCSCPGSPGQIKEQLQDK